MGYPTKRTALPEIVYTNCKETPGDKALAEKYERENQDQRRRVWISYSREIHFSGAVDGWATHKAGQRHCHLHIKIPYWLGRLYMKAYIKIKG